MTAAAINIASAVYFKCFIERLDAMITHLGFTSANCAFFKCVEAASAQGSPTTVYCQHGLIERSLIFPPVHRIVALTRPEAEYMKARVRTAELVVARVRTAVQPDRGKVLLFASIYDDHRFQKSAEFDHIASFFSWADEAGFEVVIRPHPREDRKFWRDSFPLVRMDCVDDGIEQAIGRLHPSLVVSWWSTALIDALRDGLLAVSLCRRDDRRLGDFVFPLGCAVLFWPEESARLTDAVSNTTRYEQLWHEKRDCTFMPTTGVVEALGHTARPTSAV
jgi:hypothetical protein